MHHMNRAAEPEHNHWWPCRAAAGPRESGGGHGMRGGAVSSLWATNCLAPLAELPNAGNETTVAAGMRDAHDGNRPPTPPLLTLAPGGDRQHAAATLWARLAGRCLFVRRVLTLHLPCISAQPAPRRRGLLGGFTEQEAQLAHALLTRRGLGGRVVPIPLQQREPQAVHTPHLEAGAGGPHDGHERLHRAVGGAWGEGIIIPTRRHRCPF